MGSISSIDPNSPAAKKFAKTYSSKSKSKSLWDKTREKTGHMSAYSAAADPENLKAWREATVKFLGPSLAERWNTGWGGKILFKVPGAPGAKNYGLDNLALDLLLLTPLAGGPIGKGVITLTKLAGKGLAPVAAKSMGIAIAIMVQKSTKAASIVGKIGTKGVESVGAEPVKEIYKAAKRLADSDKPITLTVTGEELKKVRKLYAKKTDKEVKDSNIPFLSGLGLKVDEV